MGQSSSAKFSLNTSDAYKALRGAVIIGASYFLIALLESIPSIDLGGLQPIAVTLSATLLELVRRFVRDYQAAP